MVFSDRDVRDYRQNGVKLLRGVFSPDHVSLLTRGVDAVIENPDELSANMPIGDKGKTYLSAHYASLCVPQIKTFIEASPMKDVVKALTGSRCVRMLYDHILVKEPNTPQRTPWHQDGAYFPVCGDNVLSIWIPMDPVTRANGRMGFLNGSHVAPRQEILAKVPDRESMDKGKLVHALPDFDRWPDLFEISSWDLHLGDALAFDSRLMHYAHGNSSLGQRRRAIAFRWFGDDTRISDVKEHVLNHEKIAAFLRKHGHSWTGRLDDPLFPTF
jgi:ectoine hydroxylase-related dioxygenase (phytanoyl-CoA dioxygenase family)